LLTCLAGGSARENLARLSLVDFSLKRDRLMFGLLFFRVRGGGWFSTLIWVPLIVVPDTKLVAQKEPQ
jgi:hypothetical protein